MAEIAAAVPAFAGVMWAIYEVLLALLVVTADDIPQCPRIQPDKTLLVLVTLLIATVAVASLISLFRHRILAASCGVLIQIPLAFAGNAADGGAAACLIG
jgi:hypothetical protein